MTSQDLFNFVQNDRQLHDEFVASFKEMLVVQPQQLNEIVQYLAKTELIDVVIQAFNRMRLIMDRAAFKLAKANAEWHDDPTKDDYAEYHTPAIQQFTQKIRTETLVQLVSYFVDNHHDCRSSVPNNGTEI